MWGYTCVLIGKGIVMPQLIRLYIASALAGFGLALGFVALLLWLDVGGLRHLILEAEAGWLGGVMLVTFNGIVFAGVQFGVAVMRMAEEEDDSPPGGPRLSAAQAPRLAEVRANDRLSGR